jgi:hypothetical protein
MNCEKCQDLISDFLDDTLNYKDRSLLNSHLDECLDCADVRTDLQTIIDFSRTQRGKYSAPPNERALWLRIRNAIEGMTPAPAVIIGQQSSWKNWFGRSWELSFAQLAASALGIVLVVSLSTFVGLKRFGSASISNQPSTQREDLSLAALNLRSRISKQQQAIDYWKARVEYNKARWNPEMRETFDRNLKVIDQAVTDSFNTLSQNPQDEVAEEMLNAALNEKLSLLKEFSEL